MSVITNQYHSICRHSTSVTPKSKFNCVNTFINDFFLNFIPLFDNGFLQRIQVGYRSASVYIFCLSVHKILKPTECKSGLFGAPLIEVFSCLSRFQG